MRDISSSASWYKASPAWIYIRNRNILISGYLQRRVLQQSLGLVQWLEDDHSGLPMEPKPPASIINITERSNLPSLTKDAKSAYFSKTGIPVTSGEYAQRVQNALNVKRPYIFSLANASTLRWTSSVVSMGTLLVTGVIFAVYLTNAVVVYDKVCQLI